MAQFDLLEIADAPAGSPPAVHDLVGSSIAEIAAARGVEPLDVLIDVVLPDRLPLTLVFPSLVPSLGRSDESWRVRAGIWSDPRTVLGGSDAGAHVDLMCHANYTTALLGESVRERGLLTLEAAVHQLSGVPARPLRPAAGGAGWSRAGSPTWSCSTRSTSAPRPRGCATTSRAAASASTPRARGVAHVFVNGHEVVRDGALTGEIGGTLLRSGRDTDTVTVPGG